MIEAALTAKLLTLTGNVYQSAAPRGFTTPVVVFTRINTDPADDLDGSPDQAFALFQIDTYHEDGLAAANLATNIRHALCAWSDGTVAGVSFHDERFWTDDTTTTRLYRVCQDFLVFASLD